MADYTFVVMLALVTLSAGLAFGGYQIFRTRRAQRRGEGSPLAQHHSEN